MAGLIISLARGGGRTGAEFDSDERGADLCRELRAAPFPIPLPSGLLLGIKETAPILEGNDFVVLKR